MCHVVGWRACLTFPCNTRLVQYTLLASPAPTKPVASTLRLPQALSKAINAALSSKGGDRADVGITVCPSKTGMVCQPCGACVVRRVTMTECVCLLRMLCIRSFRAVYCRAQTLKMGDMTFVGRSSLAMGPVFDLCRVVNTSTVQEVSGVRARAMVNREGRAGLLTGVGARTRRSA